MAVGEPDGEQRGGSEGDGAQIQGRRMRPEHAAHALERTGLVSHVRFEAGTSPIDQVIADVGCPIAR